jgi:nucleotide-binding universal stress UspA family protein
MSLALDPQAQLSAARTIFSHVLVGVDGSPESLEAVRQADLLKAPGETLTCLSAWNVDPPLVTPLVASRDAEELEVARRAAEAAVRDAQAYVPSAATMIMRGFAAHALVAAIGSQGATLVAIGSHGQGRLEGIVLGSTATQLLHDAPCSVLLTRATDGLPPRRIVVGIDGSPQSALAYAAARYLVERFDGDLTVVVAEGDKLLDLAAVSLVVGDGFRVISAEPVPTLVAAAADADLLVVGSRGLHGLKALGSVSERIAHRAACSTLVVRRDAAGAPARER